MRQTGILLLILFFLGFSFESCEKVNLEKVKVEGEMSFVNDIVPIFNDNCISCHGQGGSVKPDLRQDTAYYSLISENYCDTTLTVNDSKLYKQLVKSSHVDKTNNEEKDKIVLWIRQGSKRN